MPIFVACVAALVLSAPRPTATAMAFTAIQYHNANVLVQQVHLKWRKRAYGYYNPYRYYRFEDCYAGYLPFGYRPDTYYGCPGYGWPYWRPLEQVPMLRSGAFGEEFRRDPPGTVGEPITSSREAAQPNQRSAAGILMAAKFAGGASPHPLKHENDLTFCLKWADLGTTLVCRRPDGTAETFAANHPSSHKRTATMGSR